MTGEKQVKSIENKDWFIINEGIPNKMNRNKKKHALLRPYGKMPEDIFGDKIHFTFISLLPTKNFCFCEMKS